jgi:hypothetical protein
MSTESPTTPESPETAPTDAPSDASATPDAPSPNAPPPAKGGVLLALIVGAIIALGLGMTLLSWALSLMFMLGLFFFMLFGLLIGACMFRAASRSRPVPRSRVVLISVLVAVVGWATALAKEATDFPANFIYRVLEKPNPGQPKLYVPKNSYQLVHDETEHFIRNYLSREYPPGGILGYFRYALSNATIKLDLPSQGRVYSIKPYVPRWVWCVRVLLALPLLFLTIYSVTAGLTRLPSGSELRRKY